MKCVECGNDLPDGSGYCNVCGAKQPEPAPSKPLTNDILNTPPVPGAPPVPDAPSVPSVEPSEPNPSPTSKSKSKGGVPWKAIVGIVAAAAIVGGFIHISNAAKLAKAYEGATLQFEEGQYEEAAIAFEELGDYEDSDEMREKSLVGVTAQEEQENAGEDPDAWEEAAKTYEQLDEPNAQEEADTCRDYATYYKGKRLMERGKWKKAKKVLKPLAEAGFEDAADLVEVCETHIAYEKAEALLAEGKYYDAYVSFNALVGKSGEGLPDFSERAQACIQDFPSTGVVYSNPAYPSTAIPLTINNNSSNTYYKIYSGDDLVKTVFIEPDGVAKLNLPAGTYRMNEAHGSKWFGEADMFGDEGNYYRCIFGDEETFELRSGYSYEISTSYNYDPDSTGIGNETIDKDSF